MQDKWKVKTAMHVAFLLVIGFAVWKLLAEPRARSLFKKNSLIASASAVNNNNYFFNVLLKCTQWTSSSIKDLIIL